MRSPGKCQPRLKRSFWMTRVFALSALVGLSGVLAPACFSPRYVDCAVRCGANGECPASFSCSAGYCTRDGQKGCRDSLDSDASSGSGGSAGVNSSGAGGAEFIGEAGSAGASESGAGGLVQGGAGGGAGNSPGGSTNGGAESGGATSGGTGGVSGAGQCPPGALCDGFESGALGSVWDTNLDHGSVTIDAVHVHRGTHALHAHIENTAGNWAQAYASERTTFSGAATYVRLFVFVPASTPGGLEFYLGVIEQQTDPYGGLNLQVSPTRMLGQSSFELAPARFAEDSTSALTWDHWACVEWEVAPTSSLAAGGTGGEAKIYLNGSELAQAGLPNLVVSPGFGQLGIGVEGRQDPRLPAIDVWLDDVVIADQFIGCD